MFPSVCVYVFHDAGHREHVCVCVYFMTQVIENMCVCVCFMPQVIENASSQKDTAISALYSSLNKVILYSLSKPHQSLSECLSLLSTLGFLQEHWDLLFATYNSNASFLMCLMHCLLLLSARRLELLSSNPSTWRRDLQNPKGLYPRNFNNGHSHTLVFFHILVSHFWFNPQTCTVYSAWLGDGPREEGTWT